MKTSFRKIVGAMIVAVMCFAFVTAAGCLQEIDPAKCEHSWVAGRIITEATYETEGEQEYVCEYCDATKTEKLPKIVCGEHTWVIKETVAPTLNADGYEKKQCSTCSKEETTAIVRYNSLEAAFNLDEGTFGYSTTGTEKLELDGKGNTYIAKWVDCWTSFDLTIKNVVFLNGANFNVKKNDVKVTLENCTFYACDQDRAATDLGITDKTTGAGNGSRNNILTNSGAGMCLNLELANGTTGAVLNVKGCKFVGENDETLWIYGDKYDGSAKVTDAYKKRAHAIALNAISGGGAAGILGSLTIDDCVIDGVRGNAIQLYKKGGNIVIKNTKINSWGVNNGQSYTAGTSTKDSSAAAIRGEMDDANGRTLTLENVYFGLAETTGGTHALTHIEVNGFSGNTDGTKTAGTYFQPTIIQ